MAAYHQYWAVNKAVEATVEAVTGDHRVGVVWHTQGSGKSLSMAFYSGKLVQQPEMANPTLVVLTDRNDLDDQLFGTFAGCHELLRQEPVQAESRDDLRAKLQVASGGVVFTTIQKFMPDERGETHPLLSDRANIVVIADEAHRSQYDFIDGFARHLRDALPNASFIGFTGTPIELTDKNTRAVFGDYIDTYDIQRAVEDGATVPIYYEGRLAKIDLPEAQKPVVDAEFDEVTEATEVAAPREAQEQVGAHRGDGRHRPAARARGQGPRRPLRGAAGRRPGDADEGHGRLHEPAHLRRPVRRDREAAAGVARRRGRQGRRRRGRRGQGRDDRLVVGSGRVAAAHPQQAPPRSTGAALQGPRRRLPAGHRARHVADRLRRPEPARPCTSTSPCAGTGSCRRSPA